MFTVVQTKLIGFYIGDICLAPYFCCVAWFCCLAISKAGGQKATTIVPLINIIINPFKRVFISPCN